MSIPKKTVAVIFGGKSAEHDVSIITAHIPIIESLLVSGQFEVMPVYIAKDGSWYSEPSMNSLSYFKDPSYAERLARQKKIGLLFDNGLKLIWPGLRLRVQPIDIVFPAMHGTFGEDGSLMGLLRMANVPYVGCDLFSCAVAMDKVLTKQVVSAEGVPVVPYVWFTKFHWQEDKKSCAQAVESLSYPLFVKPVHLGSSIGISKIKTPKELENAVEVAFHYDNKVLVEQAVENLIEVTLPIMGNDILQFGQIERPMNKSDFFDFNDKYISGNQKGSGANSQYSEIPANIEEHLKEQVVAFGKKTYTALGCSGIARIDFLIEGVQKKVYVNEVNTLPGSLYHHNWKKSGVSGLALVTKLIDLAFERFSAEQTATFAFPSDILRTIGGNKTQK